MEGALLPEFGLFQFTDGNDFYNTVCNNTAQSVAASTASATSTSTPTSSSSSSAGIPPPSIYPTPIMRESQNTIVGYYPEEEGLEDVAVLGVPTFETSGDGIPLSTIYDFAVTAEYFVQNASKVDGKKKIIIDLQNNPGGTVISAYALYSVFFPNETLYSATRFRANEAIGFIGTIFNTGNNTDNANVSNSNIDIANIVKPDQVSTFETWQDLFGPYNAGGIPSSAMMAEFDFAASINSALDPVDTDGEGGVLNATTPPFAAEDILILTDGRCSSSCTIFADHMVSKGVRAVAVGGRPRPGPMQAIGGIKGSEVYDLSDIDSMAQEAVALLNSSIASGRPILSKDNITRFYEVNPIPLVDFPFPVISGTVNLLNTYTDYDDQIPTQYLYEPANCHIYYTPQTLLQPVITWALAANVTWGSGGCVDGVLPSISTGSTELPVNSSTTHTMLGLLLALGTGQS
jgi:Peptidase family S41